ncbi:MAG: hypothetical protein KAJ10_02810, partial [Thermodesulfovibrionia bacterium]|nr:hypothetical protein [Thermodesulfovibrionia bacterium]
NPKKPHEKKFDPDLLEKLKMEAPAICAWMVRGYHKYVKANGLNPPAECEEFKDKYKFSNDPVSQWMQERCYSKESVDTAVRELFKDLYGDFKTWYTANIKKNEPSGIWFTKQLEEKGYKRSTGGTRYFYGIQLESVCDD